MRTAAILIALATSSLISIHAQTDGDKQVDPPAYLMIDDSLGHELGLTNEQMKLVQESDQRYSELVAKGDKDALQLRDRDLQAVLLPSQYAQWKMIVQKRVKEEKPVSPK
jgi:hypothetical protein